VGDRVSAGMTLAIVEAMKMENKVLAAVDGQVTQIHCQVGDSIRAGDILVSVEEG
jgi:biotin carboxyl carrier protein